MIEVTADTNILISGLIFGGLPRQFILAAEDGRLRLAISDAILDEVSRVLGGKFGWSTDQVGEAMALLADCATRVEPTRPIVAVARDPDDNKIIECAVAAGSSYIVSGDHDLLELGQFENINIVRVAALLELIDD